MEMKQPRNNGKTEKANITAVFNKAVWETAKGHGIDLDDVSDGYHTFGSLYHQRAVLFAALVNTHASISWKARRHNDQERHEYCFNDPNWFIVGIDTPEGSYTYHYEMKYWDMFKCKHLEKGKPFDGHTEADVERLLSLIWADVEGDKNYGTDK